MSLASMAAHLPIWPASLLDGLWQISWHAAVVAGLVIALRWSLGRYLTPRQMHALWLLVLIRLLLPAAPASRFSLFGLTQRTSRTAPAIPAADSPPPHSFQFHIELSDSPASPLRTLQAPAKLPQSSASRQWRQIATDPRFLAAIWLCGASLLLARLLWANLSFERRTRRASPPDPRIAAMLERCRRQVGLSRRPSLRITSAVAAPAVTGLVHPRLLLPPQVLQRLSTRELRLVLLHELMHLRCRDIEMDWLWAMLTIVHWFNPVLWLIGPMRRFDRERARDQMVLALSQSAAADAYPSTLLKVAALAMPRPYSPGVVGMASNRHELRQRITCAANYTRRRPGIRWFGITAITVAGCAALTNPRQQQQPNVVQNRPAPAAPIAQDSPATAAITSNPSTAEQDANNAVQGKLDRYLRELKFNAEPLDDVIDYLRDKTSANIYVDWPALERANIARDAPVTVHLREVKFGKALQVIFKCVQGDGYDRHLGYRLDQGVIIISTQKELDKSVDTRRYDINDLLFVPPDDLEIHLDDALTGHARPAAPTPSQAAIREQRVAEIERYIMDNVAPNTWKARGGETGQIQASPLRGVLLITQSPEYHAEIQQVLAALRLSQGRQISLQTRFLAIDPAAAAKLPADLQARLAAANGPNPQRSDQPARRDDLLTDQQAAALLHAAGAAISQPRLTLFSGQRATLTMNSDIPYIASMTATVQGTAADTTTRYDPIAKTVHVGIETQLQATDAPDERAAMIDLRVILSTLDALSPEHWAGAPSEAEVFVQHPTVSTAELHTSCSIPNGQCLLLSGFEFATPTHPASASSPITAPPIGDPTIELMMDAARHSHLYLLIRPQILMMNPPQKKFPLLPPPPH